MATFHGKRGSVSFTGIVTMEVLSFTVEATCDVVDVSEMDVSAVAAATHWKEYLAGFKDWTATATCLLPTTGIASVAIGTTLGSEAALACETTDGKLYTGNAICTGMSIGASSDGSGTATFTFQGTDELEEAV